MTAAAEKVRYLKISNNKSKNYEEMDRAPSSSMPPEAPKLYKILGMHELAKKYGAKFGCSVGRRLKKSSVDPSRYESSYHTGMSFTPSSPEVIAATEKFLKGSKVFTYKNSRWRWTLVSATSYKNGRMTVLSTVVPYKGQSPKNGKSVNQTAWHKRWVASGKKHSRDLLRRAAAAKAKNAAKTSSRRTTRRTKRTTSK
jgi:hypothetical protein